MSISLRLHEAVEASRVGGRFTVSEDPGRINLSSEMTDDALRAWSVVVDACPEWLRLIFRDDTGDQVRPSDVAAGTLLRASITFETPAATLHILTPEGWRSALTSDERIAAVRDVRLAFVDVGFRTLGFRLQPWTQAPAAAEAVGEPDRGDGTSPRRLVRSGAPSAMPPSRIQPWIASGPVGDDQAAALWMTQACRSIARSLPNEIYVDQGVTKIRLVGQPPRDLVVGDVAQPAFAYDALRQAAEWIYSDGADAEIRHTFLSSELARGWSDTAAFAERLPERIGSALESAKLLYRAHLRSNGKDTLKALADLRKSLSDEIQKLVQQSRDLSASVWRDVAVALAAIGLRAITDGTKVAVSPAFSAIYAAVAVYLVVSFRMSIAMHRSYLGIVSASLTTWRTKLYGFLDDDDWKSLASKPVQDARDMYEGTERRSSIVVTIVVFGLVLLAAHEVRETGWQHEAIRSSAAAVMEWVRRVVGLLSPFS